MEVNVTKCCVTAVLLVLVATIATCISLMFTICLLVLLDSAQLQVHAGALKAYWDRTVRRALAAFGPYVHD